MTSGKLVAFAPKTEGVDRRLLISMLILAGMRVKVQRQFREAVVQFGKPACFWVRIR